METRLQIAVTFLDDSERFWSDFGSWTVRQLRGVPTLVIGHGVPRTQIPLSSVKYWELEHLPSAQAAPPDPAEVERAVRWAEDRSNARLPKVGDTVRFGGHPDLSECTVRVEHVWEAGTGEPGERRWLLTTETGMRGTVGRDYWVKWDGCWTVVQSDDAEGAS